MTVGNKEAMTTIGLHRSAKARLDKHRAPGQCYNGFIGQLIDLWEKAKEEKKESGEISSRESKLAVLKYLSIP